MPRGNFNDSSGVKQDWGSVSGKYEIGVDPAEPGTEKTVKQIIESTPDELGRILDEIEDESDVDDGIPEHRRWKD